MKTLKYDDLFRNIIVDMQIPHNSLKCANYAAATCA